MIKNFRQLKKYVLENNNLVNEVISIKTEYAVKLNEILELEENITKKKEVNR